MITRPIFFIFFFTAHLTFSQQKEKILINEPQNLLKKIVPNEKVDSWTLVYQEYARDKVLKPGLKNDYIPQFSGFKMNTADEGFYYIAVLKNGIYTYITDLNALRNFAGKIDNGEEAILAAFSKGYFADYEFKDYAANYRDAGKSFEVEVGKITSLECPFAKSHFIISVNKETGESSEGNDLGKYYEVYGKNCTNNPHYSSLEKQIQEAKDRAAVQEEIQRKMTEKMKKRLEKNRRKD